MFKNCSYFKKKGKYKNVILMSKIVRISKMIIVKKIKYEKHGNRNANLSVNINIKHFNIIDRFTGC